MGSLLDTLSCRDGGESLPCRTLNYALDGVVDSTRIVLAAGEHQLVPDKNSTVICEVHQLAFVSNEGLAEVNCESVRCRQSEPRTQSPYICVFPTSVQSAIPFKRL